MPQEPWARELLESERVASLSFHDPDDHPRVLPVTFALAAGAIWSAIDSKPKRSDEPARVRRLRRDPRAALLVHFYDDDWSRLCWVQLLGRVDVLDVAGQDAALAALRAKYPQYEREAPAGPLLRMQVERHVCWRATR